MPRLEDLYAAVGTLAAPEPLRVLRRLWSISACRPLCAGAPRGGSSVIFTLFLAASSSRRLPGARVFQQCLGRGRDNGLCGSTSSRRCVWVHRFRQIHGDSIILCPEHACTLTICQAPACAQTPLNRKPETRNPLAA